MYVYVCVCHRVVALQMKYDMVVRNSRPAAPAPPTPSAQPPASRQDSRLPVQSTAAAAAAAEDSTRYGALSRVHAYPEYVHTAHFSETGWAHLMQEDIFVLLCAQVGPTQL